jgi:excinuclease ABC subunit A
MNDKIIIKGAREHNLKNCNLEIPREKLTIITGLSGSGKSSLAFDTIYAEGQRRYLESLSSYARQFLGAMQKPKVDSIEGLSPAISIDQKTTSKNPRSTVGTVTEIYDYLRLLFARCGVPHCPICKREIKRQSIDEIIESVMKIEDRTKFMILAPVIRGKKGQHIKELENARKQGFTRVRIDDIVYDLSEDITLEKNKKHNIEIIVDRLVMKDKENLRARIADSLETAFSLNDNLVIINIIDKEDILYSKNYACPEHNISIDELAPRSFSFNNPFGSCPACQGLGSLESIDEDLILPDPEKSIQEGGIDASGFNTLGKDSYAQMFYDAIANHYNIDLNKPIKDLKQEEINLFLYGTGTEKIKINTPESFGGGYYMGTFEGVINNIERRYHSASEMQKRNLGKYFKVCQCKMCNGKRLKKESLSVTVGNKNIIEVTELTILECQNFIDNLKFSEKEEMISAPIIKEIKARLQFLKNVGLEYLTLARESSTLSGGESQRIRLATQIGSALTGVLYILDEPSIGLHQRDNDKLIKTLKELRDYGNTLIVVEHDTDTMKQSDYIVDVGPGAGVNGGNIIYAGDYEGILSCEESITGQYLSKKKRIEVPKERNKGNGKFLSIRGACANNLKNVDVDIPLGVITCITGVSGSGKSSLINEVLYKYLAEKLNHARAKKTNFKEIIGEENLDKVINIDQSPIGRTPRSNPATYIGLFTEIRELFAQTKDAKAKGYKSSRFSFNVKGGRCESCTGDGLLKIEMNFLPDVYVECDVCKGKRYNKETLEIKYKGKSIYDVLEMTVDEGVVFFDAIPKIKRKLMTLKDVGLGYIKIGQSATTLSGGEAQRVKLAAYLSKPATGKTVYILDEPTTGLHSQDVNLLIEILKKLRDKKNTIILIEHNLDIIKTADYIIDMGPEGGIGGGEIVAVGTPEEIVKVEKSYTGKYLLPYLEGRE